MSGRDKADFDRIGIDTISAIPYNLSNTGRSA